MGCFNAIDPLINGMKRISSCRSQIECVTVSRDEKHEYYNEEMNYLKRGGVMNRMTKEYFVHPDWGFVTRVL